MPNPPRRILAASLALATVAAGACDLVGRYLAGAPEDQLVRAALQRWASPGSVFLDGAAGLDPVASVSATGARAWQVAVLPLEGGAPTVWSLEVSRVETYPAFPGEAFGSHLTDRSRDLGMRTFIPDDILSRLADGRLLGVGELEVRYGPSVRSGRNTATSVAFLVPDPAGGAPVWQVQDASRSANVLLEALRTVTDEMIHRDERVLSCMGAASPAGVPRSTQLACVRNVWESEFGPGE